MTAKSALDKILTIGTGVIGIALVTRMVLRPNTAEIINAVNQSFASTLRVAVAERHIEERLPDAFDRMVALADSDQIELYAGLSDADLDWVIENLTIGE